MSEEKIKNGESRFFCGTINYSNYLIQLLKPYDIITLIKLTGGVI